MRLLRPEQAHDPLGAGALLPTLTAETRSTARNWRRGWDSLPLRPNPLKRLKILVSQGNSSSSVLLASATHGLINGHLDERFST